MGVLYVEFNGVRWVFPLDRFDLLPGTPEWIMEQVKDRGEEWNQQTLEQTKRFEERFCIALADKGVLGSS